MDQAEWTAAHVEAFAFFGGVPARLVPDNLQDRGRQARPLRPEDQPVVCGAGRALRHAGRPGPGVQAEGQAAGRTADALCSGLVLAGPGVHLAGADARRRAGLVPRGRRARGRVARWTARPRPRCSTPSSGERCSRCRPRRSCWPPGRARGSARTSTPRSAGTLYSVPWRLHRATGVDARSTPTMVQLFHHGQLVKTHPRKDRGQADRPGRLPAGEDRVPHAHPDLVPPPGRRDRPRLPSR